MTLTLALDGLYDINDIDDFSYGTVLLSEADNL